MSQRGAASQVAELLTADEVAGIFRCTAATVYRWASEGLIESVRLPGKTVRFRRSDIERMVGTTGEAS